MAGEHDELIGSDQMTRVLTQPSQKRTLQDYWNIAYRGFVPAGLNTSASSGAPVIQNAEHDAEPIEDDVQYVTDDPPTPEISAVPVIVLDDRKYQHTQRFFRAYQVQVGAVGTTQIVHADPCRQMIRLVNAGPGRVFLGDTESVGVSGHVMPASESVTKELVTTRKVWAQQETGQTGPAIVHIIVEYEKEVPS